MIATVTDQNNTPVPAANVHLMIPGGTVVWRSAPTDGTGHASTGETDGGVLPGDYNANVVPPLGSTVPSTQQNPIPIFVQSNKTVSLTF